MDYRQAEDYLLSFTDYEKTPGIAYTAANYDLRRMEKLLHPLGNPHLGTKTIHIAGTKGKGSTAAMIAEVLATAGFKSGLFTSPHLHTIRERVKVNGIPISEDEFASIINELRPIVEKIDREAEYGRLTTFEILTVLVFAYFKKCAVDCQILEAGLGGRLDATNIARADVCVITSISLDHTEVLGNTIAKIAAEKAGIIKPGCTVINFPQPEEATRIIEYVSRQQAARLIQVGKDITWYRTGGDLYRQSLIVKSKSTEHQLTIPLIGDHQLENAAASVAAVESLSHLGIRVAADEIVRGLSQVDWPGRLQILSREPMIVVDGAHNGHSMRRLVQAVKQYFDYKKCLVIFGTSCDKDVKSMAQELVTLTGDIIVTRSSHPRAASIPVVTAEFSRQGINVKVAENVPQALSRARAQAGKADIILITGSIFIVAEAIDYTRGNPSLT